MKFTISTLLTLAIAAPVAVQAFPLNIAIESKVNGGLMKIFPNDDYVKLQFHEGEEAQYIGDLQFDAPGSQRFDIVDDRKEGQEHENQYKNCSVTVYQDPGLVTGERIVFSVTGTLDDPVPDVPGYNDVVNWKCAWMDNGKQ